MDLRHVTPPSIHQWNTLDELQCPGGSASSNNSCYTYDWSPNTVMTSITTPPKSPNTIRESGQRLLPKIRDQDQVVDPIVSPSLYPGHNRTISAPITHFRYQIDGNLAPGAAVRRRPMSPPGYPTLLVPPVSSCITAPVSAPPSGERFQFPPSAPQDHVFDVMARPQSATLPPQARAHSRSCSSSSVDASTLTRYGFPTYRQIPLGSGALPPYTMMTRTTTAYNHLAPINVNAQPPSYTTHRRPTSPAIEPPKIAVEDSQYDDSDLATSTLLEYLTAANPHPALTRTDTEFTRGNTHFWFDIRNVISWTDFHVDTIRAIPELMALLEIDISLKLLPTPHRVNLNPETRSQLTELCANHHAVKVNAALKVTQGEKHVAMRTLSRSAANGPGQQPEFVASYQTDSEKTIHGEGRGRVIGIVRTYDSWNSGMRSGDPSKKVAYLKALAHLHRFMRDHGTRYGFIMTEIEVVCVRAGGAPRDDHVPLFGFLEVAAPVQVATTGGAGDPRSLKMTVDLALWYLHMLAKEQPLPGQFHWKVNVGAPAALTRKIHLPKDDWIPKPTLHEKREAKRVRGWVMPDEPLTKRETGKSRRVCKT